MVIIQQDILTERLAYLGGQTGMGGQFERKEGTWTLIRSPVYWFVSVLLCLLENVSLQACRLCLFFPSSTHSHHLRAKERKAPLGRWRVKLGRANTGSVSEVHTQEEAPFLCCLSLQWSINAAKTRGVLKVKQNSISLLIYWLLFKLV